MNVLTRFQHAGPSPQLRQRRQLERPANMLTTQANYTLQKLKKNAKNACKKDYVLLNASWRNQQQRLFGIRLATRFHSVLVAVNSLSSTVNL